MLRIKIQVVILLVVCGFYLNSTNAQTNDAQIKATSILQNTSFSGQYFMSYNYNDQSELHNILLKRGYFTIKNELNDVFSVRYTQDITLDEEGGDAGNVEMRLKYLYLKAKIDKIDFLKHSFVEVGLVHRPWLEFEQHINQYRVQGTMFSERTKIISSADFGLTYIGLIGGEIDKKYQKEINNKEAGKYGSFAIGVFNGGGYHAIEYNSNKTFESRLSLRPFPDFMPGLQISHGFAYGRANLAKTPPIFRMNLIMLSSESKYHKITAQYLEGAGDFAGKYIDDINNSYNSQGYSFFGEFLIPKSKFAVFSRYDNFTIKKSTDYAIENIIGGISYRFYKNKVLLDYQQSKMPGQRINYYELALEIAF